MPYIPYTDEQKQLANSVDLPEFLRMRGETLERAGREYKLIYHDESGRHDSITMRGSHWFDHKNQVGGGPIKFMQEHYGMGFQDAMQALLGYSTFPLSHAPPQEVKAEEKREFKLPEANDNMHRVYAYLIKQRFIAPEIITHFAKRKLLYEDKKHHTAVFVGVDGNGVPRQAHKRSTTTFGTSFRQTIEGSDTKYSFAHFGKSNMLFVFEAPIDMLSFITLYPKNWQDNSYIAMNGVYESAVLTALKEHPNLTEIVICTDNDEGGIDAADRLTDVLKEHGYTEIHRLEPCMKDWNELLKAQHGAAALPAVPHRRIEMFNQQVEGLQYLKFRPEKLNAQLYTTFRNGQYRYLAEYALAGSAYFIGSSEDMFRKLKTKLTDEYRAYSDKGRMSSKMDNLKAAYSAVYQDLKQPARTREQSVQTAKLLYELADCAVRCEVEQSMQTMQEEPVQTEKCSESMCIGYG
ncbi:MAG: DUF3991 and TOPRIM domain-containing protein [Oscillospiraceae bacterium]|nr:DUF3991 and TOPRIM domain-containing protein [Oscillospiraceae bacterium]